MAQIVNYYWDQEGVYGETIECEGMICEREMSSAGGGKQLKKVMTECPMAENSRERMQLQETSAAQSYVLTMRLSDLWYTASFRKFRASKVKIRPNFEIFAPTL